MKISAVLITKNEARNIGDCLKTVSFADERIVVDCGSSDGTAIIASNHGARVFFRQFDNFASQKNFAITKASSEWILLIDADERVTEELKEDMLKSIESCPDSVSAFEILRTNLIFGKPLRYGENSNDYQIKLFRKSEAVFEGAVHERVNVKSDIARIKTPLMHYSTRNASDYMRKLNLYTGLDSKVLYDQKRLFRFRDVSLRPVLKFIYRFMIQLGFLDRKRGFIFMILGSYYEFIRYAKLWEILRSSSDNIND